MEDPIEAAAPDDSGSVTMARYEYQVHVAVQSVLEMLADGLVRHVTCEHIEDVVVARSGEPGLDGALFWDFQQVKTREKTDPWTLADVIAKGALKSLWRTHEAVRGKGLAYRLTVGVEGYLDPADDLVVALSRGEGASREQCLKRVAKHVKAEAGPATEYLNLVRVKQLPLRDIIEARSIAVLGELGPNLTMGEITALYTQLLDRTREAMQGRLGPRWMEQLNLVDPPERLRRKRVDAASVADIRQRLVRPDHVLLGDVSQQLNGVQTALVRKLGNGAASQSVIEDAQTMRAHADHHRLTEQALGMWPDDPAIEADLDERLLLVARRTVRNHGDQARPADAIFDNLQTALEGAAAIHDKRPLYAQDSVLLMGRACALSDQCRFGWGTAHEPSA